MSEKKKKITVRNIAIMGLLVAMEVVLARFFSISLWNLRIGFAFIPLVIAGVALGPVEGAIVGALSDFLGATLFPMGAYFPGFTISNMLVGMMYGLFLHKKITIPRVLACVAINKFIISMLLSTLWISILYGSPFVGLLPARAAQSVGLFIVEIITIVVLKETLFKRIKVLIESPAM